MRAVFRQNFLELRAPRPLIRCHPRRSANESRQNVTARMGSIADTLFRTFSRASLVVPSAFLRWGFLIAIALLRITSFRAQGGIAARPGSARS